MHRRSTPAINAPLLSRPPTQALAFALATQLICLRGEEDVGNVLGHRSEEGRALPATCPPIRNGNNQALEQDGPVPRLARGSRFWLVLSINQQSAACYFKQLSIKHTPHAEAGGT